MLKTEKMRKIVLLSMPAVLGGWLVDALFWRNRDIAYWPLYMFFLIALGAWYLLGARHRKPAGSVWWLWLFSFLFALVPWFRRDSVSVLLGVFWSLFLYGIAMASFSRGSWVRWTLIDYAVNMARLAFYNLIGPFFYVFRRDEAGKKRSGKGFPWKEIWRGVMLLLALLGAALILEIFLLPGFLGYLLIGFIQWIGMDALAATIFRLFYVLLMGLILAGAWVYAESESVSEWARPDRPVFSPKFGSIELLVVTVGLACFAPLALFLLGSYLGMAAPAEWYQFGVAAISAEIVFLYVVPRIFLENHVGVAGWYRRCMVWLTVFVLGFPLLAAISLLLHYSQDGDLTRLGLFKIITLLGLLLMLIQAAAGSWRAKLPFSLRNFMLPLMAFSLIWVLINVDATVVWQNIKAGTDGLKVEYISNLSADAVPMMAAYLNNGQITPEMRASLGAALMCWQLKHPAGTLLNWADQRAYNSLAQADLSAWHLHGRVIVSPLDRVYPCHYQKFVRNLFLP